MVKEAQTNCVFVPEQNSVNLSKKGFEKLSLAQQQNTVVYKLNLNDNKLKSIKSLSNFCPKLSWLSLARNAMTGKGLRHARNLHNLVVLNATCNNIKKLDPTFTAKLHKLQALILNKNRIKVLRPFSGLENLSSLIKER